MSANTRIKTERRRNAEAAVWHTRLERGELTPYERSKYQKWSVDPENMRALRELGRKWDALGSPTASRAPAVIAARIPKRRKLYGLAAALVCCGIGAVWMTSRSALSDESVVATDSQPLREYALPDGTLVTLQPNARLVFKMAGSRRSADVPHGEIFFNVAPDPERPFVVNVGEGSVQAVGTRFAVRRVNGPPTVVVDEGAVSVKRAHGDQTIAVTAGQQLTILPSGKMVIESVDAKTRLGWARTLMTFTDQTVAQIAAEFNRRNKVKIKIADARLGSEVLPLGVFYLDDPEHFVEVLKSKRRVIVDRPDSATLRVSRGP